MDATSGAVLQQMDYDEFGNDLLGGNSFLSMEQPGVKEHLTGKMFCTLK